MCENSDKNKKNRKSDDDGEPQREFTWAESHVLLSDGDRNKDKDSEPDFGF